MTYNSEIDVEFDYRTYLLEVNVPAEVIDTMTLEEMVEEAVRIDREGQERMREW